MRRQDLWRNALAAAVLTALPAFAQGDGALDSSFHGDGTHTLPPRVVDETIRAVVVAPDGRIVAAGYRSGGSVPTTPFWASLGDGGSPFRCTIALPDMDWAFARAAAFDRQGRLVVAGMAKFVGSGSFQGWAARYLYPACTLDTSFNLDGVYRTAAADELNAVAFTSNDRVVLAGLNWTSTVGGEGIVVRLIGSNGNPDPSFDGDGVRPLVYSSDVAAISSVAVQADDRILVAGGLRRTAPGGVATDSDFLAVRLEPSGAFDDTFSGDGWQIVSFVASSEEIARTLVLDPENGSVLLAGRTFLDNSHSAPVAARLTSSGALDLGFGQLGGWSDSRFDASEITAGVRQSDGRYLLVGWGEDAGADRELVAYRVGRTGEPDPSFGVDGVTIVAFHVGGSFTDTGWAATLQGGRLVLAGEADSDTRVRGAVARLPGALVFADRFERGSTGGWSAKAP